MPTAVEVTEALDTRSRTVLTPGALEFVAGLHRDFDGRRRRLLRDRQLRQAEFDRGVMPEFLAATEEVREGTWRVAPAPDDLQDRRVEITGPVERKMMINALNSGAKVFMADFEDALAPTWTNVVEGQRNLMEAVRRTIRLEDEARGRIYELNDEIATLVVRPRGWHLDEKHVLVDGEPISASLFDFGLHLFHNAVESLERGSGPYYYLPKLEGHLEARLWNDVFRTAQERLGVPSGSIRATVLIENILAAFEMEEILYELRQHAAGLNAGRWDYIFSFIKKFRRSARMVLPDRGQVTMTVPFMNAYTDLLVRTCHERGAHAIGGMAAFIPNRRDAEVTTTALRKVREDKRLEARKGFDGSWVAHPDLVPVAMDVFEEALEGRLHQKDALRADVVVTSDDLLNPDIDGGTVTEEGVRNNVSVALQYLNSWLSGTGAAAISNLMEDAATAEISRAQLWQWIQNRVELHDGRVMDRDLYERVRDEELARLGGRTRDRFGEATEILDGVVLNERFVDFLTLPAYARLE